QDVNRSLTHLDWGVASNALVILGDIKIQQGQDRAARQILDSARIFAHRSGQLKRLAVLYPRLAKLCASEGDIRMARSFIDSSMYVNDSLERVANRFRATRAQQRADLEQVQAAAREQKFILSERI